MPASKRVFGFTQTEIAEKSGLHQSHISKYLTGKSMPALYNVKKIADACNKSIEEVSNYILEQYNERKYFNNED
jgi:transcriptional regulator with XRE-family HTH domain